MLRLFVLAVALSQGSVMLAQGLPCRPQCYAFKAGERVTYRAYYSWGFIWLSAGDVLFETRDTVYRQQQAFHFISRGWSLQEYDWIFKVRDSFEAIVDKESFSPLWFVRNTEEGGFKTYNRYSFNHADRAVSIVSYTSSRPYKEETKSVEPCTFDVLSAIYFCRNIDFNRYRQGDKIPLTMVIDNEIFSLFIRYHGKEQLKPRKNSKTYSTIKFSVMLVEGTVFKGGEDMTVWVTDDSNRIPVMVEAKILVGSVKAVITGAEGLAHGAMP